MAEELCSLMEANSYVNEGMEGTLPVGCCRYRMRRNIAHEDPQLQQ